MSCMRLQVCCTCPPCRQPPACRTLPTCRCCQHRGSLQPHSVQDVLRAASMSGGSSSSSLLSNARIARAALCVATPDDGFAEDPQALMFGRSMLAPTMSAARTAGVAGTGSSTLLHCAESSTAWQVSSELWGCQHSADVQASAAVRRRRRRAFVSVLRAGRGAVRRLAAACDNGTAGGAVDPMPAMCREA